MAMRSKMAREPTTILEALCCHRSNVIVVRKQYPARASHLIWHGFCALQEECVNTFIAGYALWAKDSKAETTITVHSCYREYLTDYRDAAPEIRCHGCSEHIQYMPPGYNHTVHHTHNRVERY